MINRTMTYRLGGSVTVAVLSAAMLIACSSGSGDSASGGSAGGPSAAGAACTAADPSLDKDLGTNATMAQTLISCGEHSPLKAAGTAIKVALANLQGDPAANFTDYSDGIAAAVNYINDTLGGVGADPVNGKAGAPISLDVCPLGLSPADNVTCTNKFASSKPDLVLNGINPFGAGMYPPLANANVPVISSYPVSDADMQTSHVPAIIPGGGQLGASLGTLNYAVKVLHAKKLAFEYTTPQADAAYQNFTANVVSKYLPGVETQGFGMTAGKANAQSLAGSILNYKPDAIVVLDGPDGFAAMVNSLTQLGWSPSKTPMLAWTSSIDNKQLPTVKSQANGSIFLSPTLVLSPELYTGLKATEAKLYTDQLAKYKSSSKPDNVGAQGFASMMTVYLLMNEFVAKNGGTPSLGQGQAFTDFVLGTSNEHLWADDPFSCAAAPKQYPGECAISSAPYKYTNGKFVQEGSSSNPAALLTS
ncbi:ABC transporter substrate-binding protein [Nocardia sp. CA-120079]|uniref:ABC transporter substrate-binding protein n=1 Tax=Nocardia sp. CA-120079 TaxID=3239974 RepID=UPI003D975C95